MVLTVNNTSNKQDTSQQRPVEFKFVYDPPTGQRYTYSTYSNSSVKVTLNPFQL